MILESFKVEDINIPLLDKLTVDITKKYLTYVTENDKNLFDIMYVPGKFTKVCIKDDAVELNKLFVGAYRYSIDLLRSIKENSLSIELFMNLTNFFNKYYGGYHLVFNKIELESIVSDNKDIIEKKIYTTIGVLY